jgi:WD40 repeat protein
MRSRSRVLAIAVLTVLTVLVANVTAVAVNAATNVPGGWPGGLEAVRAHPFRWSAGLTVAAVLVGVGLWWVSERSARRSEALVPAAEHPEAWVVDRPAELGTLVAAVRAGGSVGITTGVHGAGGFGKTTLAKVVRADPQVLATFGDRVYWVTLGRDLPRAAIAERVNAVVTWVAGEPGPFTDAEHLGGYLGGLLDSGPRRLLIVDDVWSEEQLAPFVAGGGRCTRLITTRNASLLRGAPAVRVDRMSVEQARALLTWQLPRLPATRSVDALVAETGRWPLLLRLVNKILAAQSVTRDVDAAAEDLRERLRTGGALSVDELTGETGWLDVGDPVQRRRAVRATIEAGVGLLRSPDLDRFVELGVFVEDEEVPVDLVAGLWRRTAGMSALDAHQVVDRLAGLSLVGVSSASGPAVSGPVTLRLHDEIRDYLLEELANGRGVAGVHAALVDVVAEALPDTDTLESPSRTVTAWWALGDGQRYLWEHLIEHLHAAGRTDEAEQCATDLRWVGARLARFGSTAPYADLRQVGTLRTESLAVALRQAAHLLAPTRPAHAQIDTLHSRVGHHPAWVEQVAALAAHGPGPRLTARVAPPDLPHPALRQVLTGRTGPMLTVAIAPDGTWLAAGDDDGMVQIWDAVTGQTRQTLTGHTGGVQSVAIAPDGTWLATAGDDGRVRICDAVTGNTLRTLTGHTGPVQSVAIAPDGSWLAIAGRKVRICDATTGWTRQTLTGRVSSVAIAPDGTWFAATGSFNGTMWILDSATGQTRQTLTGHTGGVQSVAIAPDGTWLATAGDDGTARIWDPATGQTRQTLTGHTGPVQSVAIAPDGTWLATTGHDGTARIWDAATGQIRQTLTGHTGPVQSVAIAPDGTWLATTGFDGTVRIWDPATGQAQQTLTGRVSSVAIAPDGTWLATTGFDGTVRIWDPATGQTQQTLTGHAGRVWAVAIAPDGTWLATASNDGTVRIWDPATGQTQQTLTGRASPMLAVAITPDGTWLATTSDDSTVRIWDAATGQPQQALTGHTSSVQSVAIAPDGTWLATASFDGTVRIWDPATGQTHRTLTGHTGPVQSMAIAPDGTWLATASSDRTVRIWDPVTGQTHRTLTGHTGPVQSMAIAPDSTWLATTGDDGTVRIWDSVSGSQGTYVRVDQGLAASAWFPDRSELVLGGDAGLFRYAFRPEPCQRQHQINGRCRICLY